MFTAGLFQFVTYTCFFNLTPLYPAVGHDLGLDAGALGAVVGIGGIIAVLVQIPGGSGGDRWGRRPFFAIALLLLVAAQLGRGLAQAAPALLMAQVLAGAALGIAGVNGWALVADSSSSSSSGSSSTSTSTSTPTGTSPSPSPGTSASRSPRPSPAGTSPSPASTSPRPGPDRRGRARAGQSFGILTASLSLGLVAGYLVAGALGSLLGWRLLSLVLAALPVAALPAIAWVPSRRLAAAARTVRPGFRAVLRSLGHRQRLALAAVAALILSAGQGAVYLLPFGLQQRDLGPFTAALLLVPYVVGSVIAAPLCGRLGDRFGTRLVIVTAQVIGAIACTVLVWGAASELALVACFTFIGGAVNGSLPLVALQVVAAGQTAGVGMGTIMAGLRMGQSMGSFIGPLAAGAVLAHAGLNAGWLAQAACLLAALAVYELGSRQAQPEYPLVAAARH